MWKDVLGFEGVYQINKSGHIRSVDRLLPDGRFRKGRELKGEVGNFGHIRVTLYPAKENHRKMGRYLLHRIVYETFKNVNISGKIIRHYDGNPKNNSLSNLRIGTSKDNTHDILRHKKAQKRNGIEQNKHTIKLSSKNSDKIRSFIGKKTQKEVAKLFNVHPTTIHYIWSGKTHAS